jgi:Heterokaryon incompatibility protein (HET)
MHSGLDLSLAQIPISNATLRSRSAEALPAALGPPTQLTEQNLKTSLDDTIGKLKDPESKSPSSNITTPSSSSYSRRAKRVQSSAYESVLSTVFTEPGLSRSVKVVEEYSYLPFENPNTQIRLLFLPPRKCNGDGLGEPTLRCRLITYDSCQHPPYAGLSYTWGDPKLCRRILIGDMVLHVAENLMLALEHLQEDEKTLVLWIDAVCINQQDEEEKGAQVQRMGTIYGSAALTLVWLGPADEESDLAIRQMRECVNAYGRDQLFKGVRSKFGGDLLERVANMGLDFATSATKALFQRPWFRRVWVTQEVLLASQVIFVCGESYVDSDDLGYGFFFSMGMLETTISGEFSMLPVRNMLAPIKPLPLKELLDPVFVLHLLGAGMELEASEARDFVYGLLGMISDTESLGLTVDYSKPVVSVYRDFAQAIVRAGRLDCLFSVWTPYRRFKDLPSWVPDWSLTSPIVLRANALPFLNSAVDCLGELSHSPDGSLILAISGYKLDRIQYPGEVFNKLPKKNQSRTLTQDEAANLANRFLDQVEKFAEMAVHAGDLVDIERLSHLPVSMYGESALIFAASPQDMYTSYRALRSLSKPHGHCGDEMGNLKMSSQFYLRVLFDGNSRQPFLSCKRILGVHFGNAQSGDWLCSLKGSAHPWILRDTPNGCYRLIGRAVIDMDSIEEGRLLEGSEAKILVV